MSRKFVPPGEGLEPTARPSLRGDFRSVPGPGRGSVRPRTGRTAARPIFRGGPWTELYERWSESTPQGRPCRPFPWSATIAAKSSPARFRFERGKVPLLVSRGSSTNALTAEPETPTSRRTTNRRVGTRGRWRDVRIPLGGRTCIPDWQVCGGCCRSCSSCSESWCCSTGCIPVRSPTRSEESRGHPRDPLVGSR